MVESEYINFIKSKGISLVEINPDSDEYAINAKEALEAIEMIKDLEVPILGGDILSTQSGNLIYAYQLWGAEYHYLNWYCDKISGESKLEFSIRSYEVAKKAINTAIKVSNELDRDCLIVLVT